jgi:hypothetical protein
LRAVDHDDERRQGVDPFEASEQIFKTRARRPNDEVGGQDGEDLVDVLIGGLLEKHITTREFLFETRGKSLGGEEENCRFD